MNQQAPPANQPSIPPPANQPVVSAQAPPPQPPQVSTPIMEPPANQQQLPQMAYAESGQPGGYFQPNFNHGQNMADLKSAPRNEDDEQETNQQYSVLGTSNALKDDEEPRRTRAMAQPAPAQAGVSKIRVLRTSVKLIE